jgi:L,D-peptidoglycan transpeptidase YkuD (ErfK/YbiS/YcfS/YnhG family)
MNTRVVLFSVLTGLLLPGGAAGASSLQSPDAAQTVVVEVPSASSTTGTLRLVETVGGVERVVLGPVAARVGRNGVKRNRREGDGTTPMGTMTITGGFGLAARTATAMPYRRVKKGDCWISEAADTSYNTWVRRARCAAPNEDLYRIAVAGAYELALMTDYNASPIVVGKGSAIFIHVHSYDADGNTKPTSGCVSISRAVMKRLFALLDPVKNPMMVVRIRR